MERRTFITATTAACPSRPVFAGKEGMTYEVTRSKDEWRVMLMDLEYQVMPEEATERAG